MELWDVSLRNDGAGPRGLSVFSYVEFSFHHIEIDNQNLQKMSLDGSGSSYQDGIVEYDFFSQPWLTTSSPVASRPTATTASATPSSAATAPKLTPLRSSRGLCQNSSELGGNHCASLHKRIELQPGARARGWCSCSASARTPSEATPLGQVLRPNGRGPGFHRPTGLLAAQAERAPSADAARRVTTSMINTWTLYQAETCVVGSRFASFVEVGGRPTGWGIATPRRTSWPSFTLIPAKYGSASSSCSTARSALATACECLTRPGSHPKSRSCPAWSLPAPVMPAPSKDQMIHGMADVCSDDALWIVVSICEFVKETGDRDFFDVVVPFADDGEATVYEHLKRSLDFSAEQIGANGALGEKGFTRIGTTA